MKTAQASSNSGAMRALFVGSALGLSALVAALYLASPAAAARPSIARDMCNQTSGNPMGYECPSADHLLVRPKYSDGTCGSWICCPPNGDGTYDCTRSTTPTRIGGGKLGSITAPLPATADPGRTPRRPKAPAAAPARTANPN
jgi:hypothetical protein